VQLSTDDTNRGRVMGMWSIIIFRALPLGNFLAGRAADTWVVAPALTGQRLACLASAVGRLGLLTVSKRTRPG
jgi:hypothetical protein